MSSEIHVQLDPVDSNRLLGASRPEVGSAIEIDGVRFIFLGARSNLRQVGATEVLMLALSFPVSLSASVAAEKLWRLLRGDDDRVREAEIVVIEHQEQMGEEGSLRVEKRRTRITIPLGPNDSQSIAAIADTILKSRLNSSAE